MMIKEQKVNVPELRILRSHTVLIVGLGSVGSAVAHVVAPFVNLLLLCDHDKVEPKNSNNQFLHPITNSQMFKSQSASKTLNSYFTTPTVPITAPIQQVASNIAKNYQQLSVIFDCVDNAEARAFIYSCPEFSNKYIVHTAISHDGFQYAVIKPGDEETRKILTQIYSNPPKQNQPEAPCHILRNIYVAYACAFASVGELCKVLGGEHERD